MPLTAPPSGKQFVLELGRQTAVVTEVGGGVRSYTVAGHEVLDGYALHEMCSDARGQVFVPWPNRVSDGRYRFHGVDHQLPLSEPAAHNAIHGLTRWSSWQLVHSNHQTLRLAHLLHPQPGYPFALRCELAYRLGSAGLAVEIRATNVGATACPYATGAHPYLTLGTTTVDDLAVRVPADTYYPTDDRGIPTGRRAVQGSGYDLRRPERLGDRVLDTAFTDLAPDPGGGSSVLVCAPDGRELQLWMDDAFRYVEIFTGDSLPDPRRRRRGLGVEPMTAAPDAFSTGDGLVVLEPGATHTASWELRPASP